MLENLMFEQDEDPAILQAWQDKMGHGPESWPIVIINGRGKARPTIDEVVTEYAKSRQ
jgi:hypothetical protein